MFSVNHDYIYLNNLLGRLIQSSLQLVALFLPLNLASKQQNVGINV